MDATQKPKNSLSWLAGMQYEKVSAKR